MGKVTGFLEFDRQEQKYQLAGDRVRHFREFTLVLDDGEALVESFAILDYLDELAGPAQALLPAHGAARRQAACDGRAGGLDGRERALGEEPLRSLEALALVTPAVHAGAPT